MKIYVTSDLHLEFGDCMIKNEDNADVLILGGDICVAQDLHDHPEPNNTPDQAAIASGLGFIGDSRSIDPLVAMLKRKEGLTDTARGFSAVALGIVADKELLPWNAKLSADMNYRASVSTLQGEGGTGILDIL